MTCRGGAGSRPMTGSDDDPPPEAQRLSMPVGAWDVSGTLATDEGAAASRLYGLSRGVPDEGAAAVSGIWPCEVMTCGQDPRGGPQIGIEGVGAFDEHELIGVEASDLAVHLFSMDQFAVRAQRGGWTDEHTLRVAFETTLDGQPVTEVITSSSEELDLMRGHVVEHVGGVRAVTTELTMRWRSVRTRRFWLLLRCGCLRRARAHRCRGERPRRPPVQHGSVRRARSARRLDR